MPKTETEQALLERITDEANAHLRVVLENEIFDWQKLRLLKGAISSERDSFFAILDILYAELSSQHETAEVASDDPTVSKTNMSAEADTAADKSDDKEKLISFLEALKSIYELWSDPTGVVGFSEDELQMAEQADAAEADAVALTYVDSSEALRDAVNVVITKACDTLVEKGDKAIMDAAIADRTEQEKTMSAFSDWREHHSVVLTTTQSYGMASSGGFFSRGVSRTPIIASPDQIVWEKKVDRWEPYENTGSRNTTVNRWLEYCSDPSAHLQSICLYGHLDGTVKIAVYSVNKIDNNNVLPNEDSQAALIKALGENGFSEDSQLVDTTFPSSALDGTWPISFSLSGSPEAILEQLDSVFAVIEATDGAPLPVSIREEIKTSVQLVTPQPESATAENDSATKHQGGYEAPGLM